MSNNLPSSNLVLTNARYSWQSIGRGDEDSAQPARREAADTHLNASHSWANGRIRGAKARSVNVMTPVRGPKTTVRRRLNIDLRPLTTSGGGRRAPSPRRVSKQLRRFADHARLVGIRLDQLA